jgi:hypothetical protein
LGLALGRFRVPEIALGAFLAVAIFAIGAALQIINPENHNQYSQPANATPKSSASGGGIGSNERIAEYTEWAAWGTFLLAISTLGLWIVTWRGGLRQSRETRIIERAYISVEPGGIKPFEGRGGDDCVACDIIINNAGNLPARKLSWVIERAFSDDAYRRDFPLLMPEAGNIVLAPKVAAIKGANSVQTSEFDDAAEGAQPDRAWLYVWGRVSYHDGFCGGRWTEFCHRYNLRGATDYAVPKENGRYHEYGNRTDET